MDNYRINKNYAKALFLLSAETGVQERVAADMRLVNDVFVENRELHIIFSNPVIKQSKKVAIVEDLFGERVSPLSKLFLAFVVRKNRAVNMRGISSMFLDMYRESRGVVLADLATSYAVDDDVLAMVGELVGHASGKNVEVNAHVDPRIIGGFVVKFDNKMYDTRIRTMIADLRKQFSANEYESKL
ncbi:MAG: ATP synthase F1 subunit delta [Bacteroidales bacterium]|jgi:F-type H+-transporting ATPase subunit delta|nr:ATP synthase F1 subunit delta [Bacteroidales bacterium]